MDQTIPHGLMTKKLKWNTAVFFSLLLWLIVILFLLRHKLLIASLSPGNLALVICVNVILLLNVRLLAPVFQWILKVATGLGKIIFALIAGLTFFLVLCPISLFQKIRGRKPMRLDFDPGCDTYFEDWQPSDNIKKQF